MNTWARLRLPCAIFNGALPLFMPLFALACPLQSSDGHVVQARSGVELAWRVESANAANALPPARKPFTLIVTLCPKDATLETVDARMPEHRHGMNYRPRLQGLGEGRWRAEGLLWHMPGRWEWRFVVRQGQTQQVLLQDVQLP